MLCYGVTNGNQMLVDLDFIPDDLRSRIIESYENTKPNTKSNMLNYFIEKNLRNLIEVIDEF
jgi:phosphoribosylformylglycinamidine (FGAM) synthase-like amidotransferase family enzyme